MKYPIVKVTTEDNLELFGVISEPEGGKGAILVNFAGDFPEVIERCFAETSQSLVQV